MQYISFATSYKQYLTKIVLLIENVWKNYVKKDENNGMIHENVKWPIDLSNWEAGLLPFKLKYQSFGWIFSQGIWGMRQLAISELKV